ncbi:MAG: protein-glutamate O-methyltransferase CheR [Clostridiales bacterium]|jgi:chemotaxis protein methyltransferase CheR|nr:protein-glutamate O-methyltransferase CheR [Clostridiales bacterium]
MNDISITEQEFWKIVNLLKDQYGINLSQKKNLIVGRLQNYLHRSNFESFSEFYDYVVDDKSGEAITLLINKLTTNYTYFLRETEHFDFFKSTVLPHISATETGKDMRIWSAGCSSGEEPYTIAMYVDDFFGRGKNGWDSKILATDISERVLSLAAEGKYLTESLEPLPPAWRENYFKRVDDENSQVVERLRREIIYRKFNLMENVFPFRKKFHIIWCRNVMIYFDAATKNRLVDKFYEHTEPGGYLFIGHSESIARNETRYQYVQPAIYRKD